MKISKFSFLINFKKSKDFKFFIILSALHLFNTSGFKFFFANILVI